MIIILCFSIVGLFYIILGLPLYYCKIKRNIFYGFRTRKTLSDEKIWKKSNRLIGKYFIIAGLTIELGTLIVYSIKNTLTLELITIIFLMLVLVPLAVIIIRGFSYLKKL